MIKMLTNILANGQIFENLVRAALNNGLSEEPESPVTLDACLIVKKVFPFRVSHKTVLDLWDRVALLPYNKMC